MDHTTECRLEVLRIMHDETGYQIADKTLAVIWDQYWFSRIRL